MVGKILQTGREKDGGGIQEHPERVGRSINKESKETKRRKRTCE